MVLLVIIGVIDKNIEHHAPKEFLHVEQVGVVLRHTGTPQQLRQVRVAELRLPPCDCLGPQSSARRNAMDAPLAVAVETAYRQRVFANERHHLGLCYGDARQCSQCH